MIASSNQFFWAIVCGLGFALSNLTSISYAEETNTVAAQPRAEVVLGYYPGYEGFSIDAIPWNRLTHICHAFITSDAQGVIETRRYIPSRRLTRTAAQHNVPVIMSIGGWGDADGFEQATSSPQKMAQFVDDATELITKYGYAGVDVDWEFPRDEATRDNFTKLVRAFRAKFDELEKAGGQHLLITSAVTARPNEGQWIDGPGLESSIDMLNVMTYDFAGPWTKIAAHHAPLHGSSLDPEQAWRSTEQAMKYWEETQGFPKHKLNVGIPLYGRQFPVALPYASLDGADEQGFGTPNYNQIQKLATEGWTLKRDAETEVPWLIAPESISSVIAYDDERSVAVKARWARQAGYRGIFFWAIGHDHQLNGRNPLIESSTRAWSRSEE